MISPYVLKEAQRLKIVARNPPPPPRAAPTPAAPTPASLAPLSPTSERPAQPAKTATVMVSSLADHRPCDYRFARRRSDGLPLEKSPPLTYGATHLLRIAGVALIFVTLWAVVAGATWLLTSG